ncbi:transposon Tf2-9 polyprotein [Trichonephila clavata]|uniref:Transposon Tf2-9 polyprotein n=1 Tax=Trichonephila clavata TaxID=2740835 RepID=A0A8X6J175_TRICU|nr:transposon Tf2-9 polyprotein [Trichonephila clavata]
MLVVPSILLGIRTSVKDPLQCSVTEMDRTKRSLVPPYRGPHQVLSRSPKHFTIQVGTRKQTISVDRLKPTFQLSEDSTCRIIVLFFVWESKLLFHSGLQGTSFSNGSLFKRKLSNEMRAMNYAKK